MDDLLLIDSINGADGVILAEDFAFTSSFETDIFISVAGGEDWFANDFLPEGEKYISQTIRTIKSNALTSASRLIIESAVKQDIRHITQNMGIDPIVQVSLSVDRVGIFIQLGDLTFNYTYRNGQIQEVSR